MTNPINQPPPFLPGPNWRTDQNQVDTQPGQTVQAGGNPLLQNDPSISGIINLDAKHGTEEPSKALLDIVAQKAGCTVADLVNKDFKLEKGFRDPGMGKDKPIPMYAYSNPPGPDCYYLVRHWKVTVDDAHGNPMEMQFSKKIYTSVEVPRNLDGGIHKQQQYIAALAARTYAQIEESRMIKGGTGKENDLFRDVGVQMSKIAHDRFVTLEMFNNAKNVAINPSKKTKVGKDVMVDRVRLKFRGAKVGKEGEQKMEGFHSILLTKNNKATELKDKTYLFMGDGSSSAHVRQVAAALNTKDALDAIRDDVSPKEAFAAVGLSLDEAKEVKNGETQKATRSFYSQLAYFNDSKSVTNLMSNDQAKYQLSTSMLDKIVPDDRSFLEKMGISKKKPEDLTALKNLNDLVANNPTDSENHEARMFLEAAKRVCDKMKVEDESITKLENELVLMGDDIKDTHKKERTKILQAMVTIIGTLEPLLPPPPPSTPPPQLPSSNAADQNNDPIVADRPVVFDND